MPSVCPCLANPNDKTKSAIYIDEENDFCSSVTWILAYYTLLYHAHVSETKDQVDVGMIAELVAEFELDGPR